MRQNLNDLPWLQPYQQLFAAYQQQRRIPQALLITGNQGLGKQQLAMHFAQMLLCNNPTEDGHGCNQCHACHLFKAETHPDFLLLAPETPGKNISIGQIRFLIAQLALKPQYDGNRVVIIHPADQLNIAAANSFLKCLEEPAERNIIILVTQNPSTLPATITSRCQKIFIEKPQQQLAINWLRQQGIDANLPVLLDLAQGSPLLAREYAEQQFIELRKGCFSAWLKVFRHQLSPLDVAGDWQQHNIKQLYGWLVTWLMDLISYCYHKEKNICYNPDLKQPLLELAQQLELKELFDYYDLLLKSKHRLQTQLNKQLLLEEILINWSQLNPGSQCRG